MTNVSTKKHLLSLIESYASHRAAEGHAGSRDAMDAAKRHHAAGKRAWEEIEQEIDKLLEAQVIIADKIGTVNL